MRPYLWSGSNFHGKGKLIADRVLDPNAISAQVGTAALLRRISDRGEVPISTTRHAVNPRAPALPGSRAAANLDLRPFEHAMEGLNFPLNANASIKVGAGRSR